ncbi:phage tail protein [Lederbergia lenta]|uniref:phage tail protein n=1 Tax=Lederbergia lenta TaxID=1467 RepID=UPI00203B145D|nr:phage tail protein [Lederbergia lenta]MCM3111677.1 phage tail protein [Lederbergia lenta]
MAYNVYQGDNLIAEKVEGKEYTVSGLTPNTEYSFSVSEVIGEEKSEKATVTVKTLPIKVTGVTLSPKTSNAESGTAGERQVTATVAPANATNKNVTYSIAPQTTGLTISSSGLIKWTADVPAGEYTTTVKTTDGNKTDTHKLTLTEPAPEE